MTTRSGDTSSSALISACGVSFCTR
jgi:hypothetical protein